MKKKIILGAASAAVILSSLTACGANEQSSDASKASESNESSSSSSTKVNYDTLAKPAMCQASGTKYSWVPVDGAEGYVASLDDGKAFGVGTSVVVDGDNSYIYYVQSTQNLPDGKHTIKFAAYKDGNVLSAWTDSYTFYVNNTIVMSTPTLDNNLTIRCSNFNHVTYDFGNGYKIEEDLTCETSSYTPNISALGIDKKLNLNEPYFVTCTVSLNGVVSEASNPVVFKLQASKYVKAEAPSVVGDEDGDAEETKFVFAEAPSYYTVKIDDKEYTYKYEVKEEDNDDDDYYTDGDDDTVEPVVPVYELTPDAIFERLIEDGVITEEEALGYVDTKISVKVLFDANHYYESDYSEEIEYTYAASEDGKMWYNLWSSICWTANLDVVNKQWTIGYWTKQPGYTYVNLKVTDSKGKEVPVTKGDSYEEMWKIDYSAYTSTEYCTITFEYERNGEKYSESKIMYLQVSDYAVTQLHLNRDQIKWSFDYEPDSYEVEVTQNGTTKVYTTEDEHIATSEFELEAGEFTLQVYSVVNDERVAASASEKLTLKKLAAPKKKISVSKDNKISVQAGMVLHTYNVYGHYAMTYDYPCEVSLTNIEEVVAYYKGNNINTINSDAVTYNINIVRQLNYDFVDAKYLILVDRDLYFKDLVSEENQKYITDDNKFDYDSYRMSRITGDTQNLMLTTKLSELDSDSDNTCYNLSISPRYVTYTPDSVVVDSEIKLITVTQRDETDFNYEITIEDAEGTVLVNKVIFTNNEFDYSEVSGITSGEVYKVKIRIVGNGSVLSGNYSFLDLYL